ncbi:MAG: hypothetical protein LBR34_01140 [Prevotella sp.]|jgi:hypothetical protein|nr:hypothetical protein [Prevotella sp.]
MKKTIFKVQLLLVGAIALMLTSCLGESENSVTSSGDFVYVTHLSNGTKVAASLYLGAYLVSDELSSLSEGDCALVDYKVNFEKTQGDAYVPDYFQIDRNNVFRNSSQFVAAETEADPYEMTTKNDIFVSLNIAAYSYYEDMGDRWLFSFAYKKLYEGEEAPQLQIFYNPNTQSANDLENGVVTLDVTLSRVREASGEPIEDVTLKSVVNFSELRSIFASYAKDDATYTNISVVKIKFRYPIALTSNPTDDEQAKGYKLYNPPLSESTQPRLIYTK